MFKTEARGKRGVKRAPNMEQLLNGRSGEEQGQYAGLNQATDCSVVTPSITLRATFLWALSHFTDGTSHSGDICQGKSSSASSKGLVE